MPTEYSLPIVKAKDESEVYATVTLPYTKQNERKFASIHSNPPGISTHYPALIVKKYGKGNVVWSAAPIELDSRPHYKKLLLNLMNKFVSDKQITLHTTASKKVEIVTFKTENAFLVSSVDLDGVNEVITRVPFDITLKTNVKPTGVNSVVDGRKLEFLYENGSTTFTVQNFRMFDMYEIKL